MIFRVTRSVFARYGRPAIILFAITGPMPGSESRSSALALLISIRPFLLDTVEPVVPVADFGEELVWAAASVTAVKMRSSHRVTFIERFYQRGLSNNFPRHKSTTMRRPSLNCAFHNWTSTTV